MTEKRISQDSIVDRLRADPDLMQRRLKQDLSEVRSLGRLGVRLDINSDAYELSNKLHSKAGQLGFVTPIIAATQSKRRLVELPTIERATGTSIQAYHTSASNTVIKGSLVKDEINLDGTRSLVFQRQGLESDMVSVTLEANVSVEIDGMSYLKSYGWPTSPQQPVHTFNASSTRLLEQALFDLSNKGTPLDRALLLLWGSRLQKVAPIVDDQQRAQLVELISTRSSELNTYIIRAEDYASMPTGQGWYAACLYRSALENLFESYLGEETFLFTDIEDINDLDEELRDNFTHAQGDPNAVPRHVPGSHWWWSNAVSGIPSPQK